MFSSSRPSASGIAFSPDGQYLVAGNGNKVVLLRLSDYKFVKEFLGHQDSVRDVGFASDGTSVVSTSYDQTVRIWNVASGKQTSQFAIPEGIPNAISLSPTQKFLLAADSSGNIHVWDVTTAKEIHTLAAHNGEVKDLAYAVSGETFFSGGQDGIVKQWDTQAGMLLRSFTAHRDAVFTVTPSPDGALLLSGSVDKTMRIWDLATGTEVLPPQGHIAEVSSLALTSDSGWLLSGSIDKTAKLWQMVSTEERQSWACNYEINAVAIQPGGCLAAAASNTVLYLWNTSTGQLSQKLEGQNNQVRCLAFSEDGNYLYSTGWDPKLYKWDVQTGKALQSMPVQKSAECMTFLNDNKIFACGYWTGDVSLWDMETEKLVTTWKAHPQVVTAIGSFAQHLITGSEDGLLKIWDVPGGTLLNSVTIGKPIKRFAILPETDNILLVLEGKELQLYSLVTLQKLQTISQAVQPISATASIGGKNLLIGNANGSITWYKKDF